MNKKILLQQKEETEYNLSMIEMCKDNLMRVGVVDEGCIPTRDREEFRNMILDFLKEKEEEEEFNKNEVESSLAFYNF